MVVQKKVLLKKSNQSKSLNGEITVDWVDNVNRRLKNIENDIMECQRKLIKIMGRMGL
jgi:hypothetical protein